MPAIELMRHGARVMTVCNACRYCEQYCPVFPAMERRGAFGPADLTYLANLCHNCGECLYACQYAPPHEFGINVPATLTRIRVQSYEDYAWPRFLSVAFRHHNLLTGCLLAAGLATIMLAAAAIGNGASLWQPGSSANFYLVVPHAVMVALFGGVSVFVLAALVIGTSRCVRDIRRAHGPALHGTAPSAHSSPGAAWRDVLTLRHLHATGSDCVSREEVRTPWRRWFHHATFYGFALCFASTSVAAVYHGVFGWFAPYAYTSAPVLLGVTGGVGLLIGSAGLFVLDRRRDPALGDAAQRGLDVSFLALLFLSSATGLMLLAARHLDAMSVLLLVHLGVVLALILTLPYGKFVHGLYRTVALIQYHRDISDTE